MRAITASIGQKGIQLVIDRLLRPDLEASLRSVTPVNSSFYPDDIPSPANRDVVGHRDIHVHLKDGSFLGYVPTYTGCSQGTAAKGTSGKFLLGYTAAGFYAKYNWTEEYEQQQTNKYGQPLDPKKSENWFERGPFNLGDYKPLIGLLAFPITLRLVYDASARGYDILASTEVSLSGFEVNLPKNTVLRGSSCKFDDSALAKAGESFANVGFSAKLQAAIPEKLASIAASGQLTPEIVFEFDLCDPGILYPNDDGISMGVTGSVSYLGERYEGTPPEALPSPAVPSEKCLTIYMSSYELDALHWAYWRAGMLDVEVDPDTLKDLIGNSAPLRTENYTYLDSVYPPTPMHAQIAPKQAPTTTCQAIYEITDDVLKVLQPQLLETAYDALANLDGKVYLSKEALEKDLTRSKIGPEYFSTIEDAARAMGMVVSQTLGFTVTIETDDPPEQRPNVVFDVTRKDVLRPTALGPLPETPDVETLKFEFDVGEKAVAQLVSSTVPGYADYAMADFNTLWKGCEISYDQALTAEGNKGVPVPMMDGFQFLLDAADLSVQDGYLSISANVEIR